MIVVVGGSGRKVGKSSLIESLIRALPEARWLAIKVSGHVHGADQWKLERHQTPDAETDTGRFLAAGAREAWWLRAGEGHLAAAAPELQALMAGFENVIIESNSIIGLLCPDLYLFVAGDEWKESAGRWLANADSVIVTAADRASGEPLRLLSERLSLQAEK